MKKFISIAAITAVLALTLTACNNSSGKENETTTSAETTTTVDTTTEETTTEDEIIEDGKADSTETREILQTIHDAYGENYLPNTEIAHESFSEIYGISSDLYIEAVGEVPMIGFHPDCVMIFKAAEGKADELEAAVKTYRDTVLSSALQYPVNIAKVNASKVVRKGDFVAFLLVGAPDEREAATEDEAATFAEEQVQIAVDAFNGNF